MVSVSLPYAGYPQPGYSNDLDCRWFIEVNDPSAILEIAINRIRMEQNCKYDRLEIYEGVYFRKFINQNKWTIFHKYVHLKVIPRLYDLKCVGS